jgi:hypothetical protein
MDNLKKLVLIVLVLLVISFGFVIYNHNVNILREGQEYEAEIERIKSEQEKIDDEFYREQREIDQELEQKRVELENKDEDNDGLTYAEEVELGTDDTNVDSDGDYIPDPLDAHPSGGGDYYKKTVQWTHDGLSYQTQFGIHEDKYLYYKNQERTFCCGDWYKYATPNDPTIQTIAKDIVDVSIATGEQYKHSLAIDFVESMVYELDVDYNNRDEYPKYPIETIIDGKGDCEDTSFLMASVLEALNIDTVLLVFPGHVAVGVWCEDCTGGYFEHNSRKYFYLETTGYAGNWEVGWVPLEYEGTSAKIIDV